MKNVLIIDDEEKLRNLLARIISYEGFDVHQAENCKSALQKTEKFDIDVVICDVKLPDGNGMELSKEIKKKYPLIEIILLTAYGNIPDGVQAIKNGAFDYITKGDDNNKIIPLVVRAFEKVELAKRVQQLEKQLGEKYSFSSILGTSTQIKKSIELAKKVAASDTTVLITGETGTGKEVFAQAIHQESNRKNKSFVALNCSAISKDLLESELFGHKAGAFSGAIKDHKGLFSEANNGTIFLDEIGELALDLQAKLLRVIDAGEFYKVGESKPTKIDVRIITATNRNLQKEILAGTFREDLFYRISAFQIPLPPLRDRSSDIEIFANYFLRFFSIKTNKKIEKFAEECLNALKQYPWKGNIRELRNIIERCVIMTDDPVITSNLLPSEIKNNPIAFDQNKGNSSMELTTIERLHIQNVLNYTNGNKTKTAELLGIALTTLYRKLAEYKIE